MAKTKETSTNKANRDILLDCNLTYALQLMGGRWKLPILMNLRDTRKRFGELKKLIPHITERMLTLQLRELERDGLITRTVYAEVPPRVEYELTRLGEELIPICEQLYSWGGNHKLVHYGEVSTFLEV